MVIKSKLQNLLENFTSSLPGVEGVVVASVDGLSIASVISTKIEEERTSAISAAMFSLAERIAGELYRGHVEQILVEGEEGKGILVSCGTEAILLVLTKKEAKLGLLFLQVKRLTEELLPLLSEK
ncbi:MAG: roadblock/LC7 domain-containing protein [Prochloraceae cyanobacterium]|nr:roadblock/LC7 domain-containing protein [Prochloraceae cyanobacterium]